MGNGDGTFEPAETYGAGNNLISILAGDFTGHGKLDLAVLDENPYPANLQASIDLLLNNGDGIISGPGVEA